MTQMKMFQSDSERFRKAPQSSSAEMIFKVDQIALIDSGWIDKSSFKIKLYHSIYAFSPIKFHTLHPTKNAGLIYSIVNAFLILPIDTDFIIMYHLDKIKINRLAKRFELS